jgi:hypothetical protein
VRDRASERACLALAVVGGAVVGLVDLVATEVWPALLGMLLFGVGLGFLRPRLVCVWAAIIGFSVPLAHLLAGVVGYRLPYAVVPNRWATVLALIPAAVATLLGVAANWVASRISSLRGSPSHERE